LSRVRVHPDELLLTEIDTDAVEHVAVPGAQPCGHRDGVLDPVSESSDENDSPSGQSYQRLLARHAGRIDDTRLRKDP
jgi:hypothetical protein